MNPAMGHQKQTLAEAVQKYDGPKITETGILAGWGDAGRYAYFDCFTPKNEYLVERDYRITVESGEMPFMILSYSGPGGCRHQGCIWLRNEVCSGWANVFVSTVLNELEGRQRQRLIDHLEQFGAGRNPDIEERVVVAQPPLEENQP
jgi:hypothetical protein